MVRKLDSIKLSILLLYLLLGFMIFQACGSSSQEYTGSEDGAEQENFGDFGGSTNNNISFVLEAIVRSTDPDTTINLLSEDINSFTITDKTTGNKTALAVDDEGKARMFYAQSSGAFDIALILEGTKDGTGKGMKIDTLIVIRENDPKQLSPQIIVKPSSAGEIKLIENLLRKRGIGTGSSMIDKPGS